VLNLPAYGWLLSAHDRRVHNVGFTAAGRRCFAAGFRVQIELLNLLFPLMLLQPMVDVTTPKADVATLGLVDALFYAALAAERAAIGSASSCRSADP